MQKEVALIKVNEKGFYNILTKVKRFFAKFTNKNNEIKESNTNRKVVEEARPIDDFIYLKLIMEGKAQIKDLDKDLKRRLINLCNERLNEVNKEIAKKERQIKKAEEILEKVSNM